jgi:hypothetical protein
LGDAETVGKEFCNERHLRLDREIEEIKDDVRIVKGKQDDYNTTLKNIYYSLLIIAFATILTLAGVVLGRAVDFHIPL